MNILKDNELILAQIESNINNVSKIYNSSHVINWFQQSSIHWMIGLFIMKYYYLNTSLSKQQLIEELNTHIPNEGKKTITTEFRYIEDCENKNYITTKLSQTDHRKKVIKPCQLTIDCFEVWFKKQTDNSSNPVPIVF